MLTPKNILIFLFLWSVKSFGQDTTAAWLQKIDTLSFKTYYSKKQIPPYILKYIEVEKLKEIANPGKKYRTGCIGSAKLPSMRLNWVAKDKQNHSITSISFGGKGRCTRFYYLDYDANKPNINELSFGNSFTEVTSLTFGATVTRIKNKKFEFEEYEEPEPDED